MINSASRNGNSNTGLARSQDGAGAREDRGVGEGGDKQKVW